jgi:hypothetical protein
MLWRRSGHAEPRVGVAPAVRRQQSGRCPRGCCSCACFRSSWLTVEGGRQVGAAGVLHRRGGRAAVAVRVGVAGGVPNRYAARPRIRFCFGQIACRDLASGRRRRFPLRRRCGRLGDSPLSLRSSSIEQRRRELPTFFAVRSRAALPTSVRIAGNATRGRRPEAITVRTPICPLGGYCA